MKKIYVMLLAFICVGNTYQPCEASAPPVFTKEEESRMAEPDFCVRLVPHFESEALELGRPFIKRFLNPATVEGLKHPLTDEHFDIASILLDTMTLACDRKNQALVEILQPVFDSGALPRTKVETARLVTTLPLADQGSFVELWREFYEENAHPKFHKKIVINVRKAERREGGNTLRRRPRFRNIHQAFTYDFEGHIFKHAGIYDPLADIPLKSIVLASCPLETFLINLSEILFLFPEEARLLKGTLLLSKYSEFQTAEDFLEYVLENGQVNKELSNLIESLLFYEDTDGENARDLEVRLPGILSWYASVSPIITVRDLQHIKKRAYAILEKNGGEILFSQFYDLLQIPHSKWDADRRKKHLGESGKKG